MWKSKYLDIAREGKEKRVAPALVRDPGTCRHYKLLLCDADGPQLEKRGSSRGHRIHPADDWFGGWAGPGPAGPMRRERRLAGGF